MKLLKVLVAALVLAAMVAPAMAEDRLSLSGEMRVRAFHTDYDFDGDTDDSTDTWANQRLRIAGKIAVAEGVSVTFRTDITEGTNWGDHSTFGAGAGNPERTNGFGSARSGSQQQWDRAHMDIVKNGVSLRAGQLYFGTGGTFAIDTQDNGLVLGFNPGVKTEAFFIVDRNNGASHDGFLSGLGIAPKGDNWSAKFYIANQNSCLNLDEDVYAIIASGSTNLNAIKLFGELDIFTGDATASQDAMGTQLFIDASMAASDSATVGAQFFYAAGDDEDKQYVRLGNGFNGWDPIMDVGTSLSNEEIPLGNAFDWYGANAGVVGARLYGNFKASDALSFGASLAYLETEEDDAADADAMALAAGMVYKVAANTSFQLQLQYTDGTDNDADADFDGFEAGTGLFVSF